jgi:hypothetical protein
MKSVRRAAAIGLTTMTVALVSHAGPVSPASRTAESALPARYVAAGLLSPAAKLEVVSARTPAQVAPHSDGTTRALAADARRFNTWSGYSTLRFPEAVATGDFNADGAVDVAFARSDFFAQGMTVQLNAGDGTMGPATSYPATDESSDIKAGDLDGDGDLDLAVVSLGSNLRNATIDLYFNDGDGAFTRRIATGGLGPQRLVLADLDGDSDLDMAMSSGWFERVMSVLLNNGDGTFGAEARYTVGDHPKGIAAADFNRDGRLDLAVARDDPSTLENYVQIWVNDGTGGFTRAREITLVQAAADPSLVAADFNRDGRPDLAVGMYGDRQVVMLGRARLAFDQRVYVTGYTAWDLCSGDLDGDGDGDIALATLGSSSTGDMSILRNGGDGTFTPVRFSSGFNPHDCAIADFDADGKADIAVAQGGTETGSIHLQRPNFKFGAPPLARTDLPIGSLEASDVEHDGDLDLATSINDPYGGGGFVQIMENDGRATFSEAQRLPPGIRGAAVGHVQPADLDGDGWDDLVWNLSQFNEPVAPIATSLNDGTGVFGPPVVFEGTARNGSVAVGDLDNDGDIDLASPQFTPQIAVYLNNGDATFGPASIIPVAEFPGMIVVADFTGDGVLDLATVHNGAYGSSEAISVLRGTGNARYAHYDAYRVGQGPIGIVAADLDEDGDLDLVTSNNGGDDISNFEDESTTVLLNDGFGQFGHVTTYAGETVSNYLGEWAVAASDIDGDGHLDIVVSNVMGNNAGVYYGRGDGTLEPEQVRYGLQNGAQDLTVADFDGDGSPDVAASGYLQSVDPLFPPTGIVVLKNRGGGGAPGSRQR